MKLFWLDTETTGLEPERHAIIQLAAIIEIDGEVKETIDINIKPHKGAMISREAMEINGITAEQLREYPEGKDQHAFLSLILSRYVDKYDREDKFVIGGQNPKFDIDFLKSFFQHQGDQYFGSWFNYHHIDTTSIGALLKYHMGAPLPNLKLESICKYMGIELKAHDALEDIEAAREVFIKFKEYLK